MEDLNFKYPLIIGIPVFSFLVFLFNQLMTKIAFRMNDAKLLPNFLSQGGFPDLYALNKKYSGFFLSIKEPEQSPVIQGNHKMNQSDMVYV
jgi:hypothetical protein